MKSTNQESGATQDLSTAVVAVEGKRYGAPQGPSKKDPKVPPSPRKLGVSIEQHPGRRLVAEARLRAIVEQEAITRKGRSAIEKQVRAEVDFDIETTAKDETSADATDRWVEAEVEKRMRELAQYDHPLAPAYIVQFGPDPRCRSKRPAGCDELAELLAMRRIDLLVEVERALGERADNMGARSERKMSVATFMVAGFTGRPKVLRSIHAALSGSDMLLDEAVGHPGADYSHCRAYNSVTVSLDRQLNTQDPEILLAQNGKFLEARREAIGPDYGRHVVLDAMPVEAHLIQHDGYSDLENQLLRRGLTAAQFGYHGDDKAHTGWALMTLRCIKSLDILGWLLAPYRKRENGFAELLFTLTQKHFPSWRPEVLIADKEYDVEGLHENLLAHFGTHLICPLRNQLAAKYTHGMTKGVPKCSKHGLMKRVRDREFPHQDVRTRLGLQLGERASVDRARTEWACVECGAKETTYFKTNPRLFGYYPHKGDHKLVGQRQAMQVLRNIAESTNSSLQCRHFGLTGQARAKWVSTDRQCAWLLGAGLFAMNLRQLIHGQGGLYDEVLAEVDEKGLRKPRRSTPGESKLLRRLRLVEAADAAAGRSERAGGSGQGPATASDAAQTVPLVATADELASETLRRAA